VTKADVVKDYDIDLDLKNKTESKEVWDSDKNEYVTNTVLVPLNKSQSKKK
jgi:hypothetical protein